MTSKIFPQRNFKIILEYEGTHYHGWQLQKDRRSLQGEMERAIQEVTQENIRVYSSGRTDAGVHAFGQVLHFHSQTQLSLDILQKALNVHLPVDMVIRELTEVSEDFHALLDAKRKTYYYFIYNHRVPELFLKRYSWQIFRPLDWKKMKEALSYLKGEHDFKSFQSVGTDVKTTVRTLYKARILNSTSPLVNIPQKPEWRWMQHPDLHVVMLEGNGFLKQMVRNIVGTLVEVGYGKISVAQFKKILAAKDRKKAGPAAPAQGLFLVKVSY